MSSHAFVKVPVPSHVSERSCIYVLRGIDFVSYYVFATRFWNCSDMVVLFILSSILLKLLIVYLMLVFKNYIVIICCEQNIKIKFGKLSVKTRKHLTTCCCKYDLHFFVKTYISWNFYIWHNVILSCLYFLKMNVYWLFCQPCVTLLCLM